MKIKNSKNSHTKPPGNDQKGHRDEGRRFGLDEKQYVWIGKILKTYLPDAKVFVFGSRASGTQKQYSDLDLAIDSKKDLKKVFSELNEIFSKSFLPFRVDLIELGKINTDFREAIQEDLIRF